jgi:hypothetical protein
MNALAFVRSPLRLLPLALLVTAMGAWASQGTASATVEPTFAAAAVATIAPYGAVAHDTTAAPASILPYGAMTSGSSSASASILPYGAINHDATTESASILPYGAVSPRVAP